MITNSTAFPFDLTTHSAYMLIMGIEDYINHIDYDYKKKLEQPDYLMYMIHTVNKETVKIRNWVIENEVHNVNILNLDKLLTKIERLTKKLEKINNGSIN